MLLSDKRLMICIGARGSKLSQAQVWEVEQEIQKQASHVKFCPHWIETQGDKDLQTSLKFLDKTDFFTREIDEMQIEGAIRLSIHSAKDLPDPLPKGLVLAALTKGLDPSDSLVFRENESLSTLPRNALIATSSFRRQSAIGSLRADFQCVDIRGSIEKRLEKLDQKEIDGLVVAECALIRLQLTHRNRLRLNAKTASLQGQLAVIARQNDHEMIQLFKKLDIHAKNSLLGD